MGNASDKLSDLGDQVKQKASDLQKTVKALFSAPKHPISMPDLGDGRNADQLRTEAEVLYGMDTKQCINVGLLGQSNELKTALINSLRYVADTPPDFGIVNPNKNAVQYVHADPSYKHVRFWDIYENEGTYIQRCLYAFDALILVTPENLRPNDIPLILEAGKFQAPSGILIVRSGMDLFVDSQFGLNPQPKDVINGKTQQGVVIKDNLKSQLTKGGLNACALGNHIYLVSAPGMLAARGVNFDGTKYIWDEFDLLRDILDSVAKRRY